MPPSGPACHFILRCVFLHEPEAGIIQRLTHAKLMGTGRCSMSLQGQLWTRRGKMMGVEAQRSAAMAEERASDLTHRRLAERTEVRILIPLCLVLIPGLAG